MEEYGIIYLDGLFSDCHIDEEVLNVKKVLLVFIVILLVITTGCVDNFLSNGKINSIIFNNKINDGIKTVISEIYVNNIRYNREDIDKIYDISKHLGIENPYIPTKGILTDFILNIKEDGNSLAIIFPHFSIIQSLDDTIIDKQDDIRKVKTDIGDANWILKSGVPSNIYVKIDDLYVTINPRRSFNEENFEDVLDSLLPLLN